MAGHVWEAAAMVMIQVGFVGINIFYKLDINAGMDMWVLIAYRFLFATVFFAPLALFIERKSRPRRRLLSLEQEITILPALAVPPVIRMVRHGLALEVARGAAGGAGRVRRSFSNPSGTLRFDPITR